MKGYCTEIQIHRKKFLKDNMFEISLTDEFSVNNMEKNIQQIQNVIKMKYVYYQKNIIKKE